MQQGLCQKEKPLDNSLCPDDIADCVSIQICFAVTIIFLFFFPAHFLDQDVGDLGLFDNRDVLSVAHTSLQEASIGEP